jgi:hypothetical protein
MGRLIIMPIPKRQIDTHETKSLRLGAWSCSGQQEKIA